MPVVYKTKAKDEEERREREVQVKISMTLDFLEEQYTPKEIARALEGLLFKICFDECMKSDEGMAWAKKFIPNVAYNFFKLEQDIEVGTEMGEARYRSEKAGGRGKIFN